MNFCIESKEDYDKLIEYLYSIRKVEDDYHRSRHLKIINTSKYVISIDTATLKKIASLIYKNSDLDAYISQVRFDTYEETLIYGLVLSHIKDMDMLTKIAKDICYYNAKSYFDF